MFFRINISIAFLLLAAACKKNSDQSETTALNTNFKAQDDCKNLGPSGNSQPISVECHLLMWMAYDAISDSECWYYSSIPKASVPPKIAAYYKQLKLQMKSEETTAIVKDFGDKALNSVSNTLNVNFLRSPEFSEVISYEMDRFAGNAEPIVDAYVSRVELREVMTKNRVGDRQAIDEITTANELDWDISRLELRDYVKFHIAALEVGVAGAVVGICGASVLTGALVAPGVACIFVMEEVVGQAAGNLGEAVFRASQSKSIQLFSQVAPISALLALDLNKSIKIISRTVANTAKRQLCPTRGEILSLLTKK